MRPYDASAIGSDIARSPAQALARRWARLVVGAFGLNRPGFLATEIVQQIRPICVIPTRGGPIRCVGGHGRLRWRARTFYTEEPETIRWLDALPAGAVLWDIGSNVGLYALYAAKLARCAVVAFEPEAQNYALLLENLVLNGVRSRIEATNVAVTRATGLGRLHVHAITKGGAYNQFRPADGAPQQGGSADPASGPITPVQMGVSMDDLVAGFRFPQPTHVKIDVDGNEPDIIAGGLRVLGDPRCVSVLIEIQRGDPAHDNLRGQLTALGYQCVSERSNWDSRANRVREQEHPATNLIFAKGAGGGAAPCAAVPEQGGATG